MDERRVPALSVDGGQTDNDPGLGLAASFDELKADVGDEHANLLASDVNGYALFSFALAAAPAKAAITGIKLRRFIRALPSVFCRFPYR